MDRQQVITAATVVAVAVLAIGGTYWVSTYYTKRRVDVVLARVRPPVVHISDEEDFLLDGYPACHS